ncbi:FAD-dependent oxidoreductase [Deinococcus yavapaiensis]|uniref:FAD dependent oxidoreductase n=1 Tax=Deinococcus yavapaiensis KR-236 TaxID=694435 RepID=A0A318S9S1_9DEIO|nr:FAD-dependent oxidoreductase [Deinococcus yavapaiensis]PYE54978.1 FAD dependent oxidoreductase [Deinococcus yavapaiensis KR-236]
MNAKPPESARAILLTAVPADLLVVGGGLAGIAAAMSAARRGASVVLTEEHTMLGRELFPTLRPWLDSRALKRLDVLLGGLSDVAVTFGGEAALVPDAFKIALEDRLLDAGVRLLYGLRPVERRGSGPFEIAFASKQGLLAVRARRLVDATPRADLAAWSVPDLRSPLASARRTVEFTGADLNAVTPGVLAVPEALSPDVRVHLGAARSGHVLIEHVVEPPFEGTSSNDFELHARSASFALARWLCAHHPAFVQARVTGTSLELTAPPARHLHEPAFRHPDGFWVTATAPRLPGEDAEQLAALAELGWSVGERAWDETPPEVPGEVRHRPLVRSARVDVLVIGGGTSGTAAAIGAARRGASVLLADMNMGLGGAGTLGGVDSYWFGRRGGFNAEVSAWTQEQQAWMNWPSGAKWNVEAKMFALTDHARREGVDVVLGALHLWPILGPDGRVRGARLSTRDGLLDVTADITVDATGDADVAVAAGAEATYGSLREGVTMWYSLAPHPRPGLTKNNFTSNVDVGDPDDYTRAILSGRRRVVGHDHGPYVAPRETRHVLGEARLTLTDQLTRRRWRDVVNVHFSNHDVKGHATSDWLRLGLIPPNLEVEIPYRALVPLGPDGLLVTGKAISAEHDALPAIRMQADLENLGFACGVAAALCVTKKVEPRHLRVEELQRVLVDLGALAPSVLERSVNEHDVADASTWPSIVASFDDAVQPYELSFKEFHEVWRGPIPFVQACTAGPGILPLLRAHLSPSFRGRVWAARALAWYGDRAATPVLLEAIDARLASASNGTLPHRVPMPFTQASPDHAAMPDLAYLLHALALTRDERSIGVLHRIVDRLDPTDERLRDHTSGLFHYVDAVCDVCERLGDPRCLSVLARLRAHPFLRGHVTTTAVQPDFFLERLAHMELLINRAAARCGDADGARTLIEYLDDPRRPLARHARRELTALAGEDLGPGREAWRRWISDRARLDPRPWRDARSPSRAVSA